MRAKKQDQMALEFVKYTDLPFFMVDHDIVRPYVSVHDTFAMAEI